MIMLLIDTVVSDITIWWVDWYTSYLVPQSDIIMSNKIVLILIQLA